MALSLAGVLVLAGCQGGGLDFLRNGDGAEEDGGGDSVRLVDRDVEAPEVFQVTGEGLWDGRPSLGGVWVAYPDVKDPERVIIRNEANGKFVIGALFRREREAPGPPFQVSSDAASALEMLAGAPVTLNVTALRRQEVPISEETATDEAAAPVESTAPDAGEAGADVAETAGAAIEAAEAGAPDPAPVPTQTSALAKPYIQIGLFSVQANANGTGDTLRDEGIVPLIEELESRGKTFWRVLVGPAATSAERADLLAKVKTLGFSDAYFVSD